MQPIATVLAAIMSAGLGAVLAYVFGVRRIEHEQRFSRLQERRADIIAKTHTMLLEIQLGFERLMDYYQTDEPERRVEQDKVFLQKLNQFRDYYELHAVWLDDSMWHRLHQVSEEQRNKRNLLKQPRLSDDDGVAQREVPAEVRAWVRQDLPKTMATLKHEFRQILGVENTSSEHVAQHEAFKRNRVPWILLGILLAVAGLCLVYVQFEGELQSVKGVDWESEITAVMGGLLIGAGIWMIVCQLMQSRR